VGKYGTLGSAFDRIFRNTLNKALDDVDVDIKVQKKRVDDLIVGNPQPSEVVDSRGGFPVLKDRLDGLDSSVAQKLSYPMLFIETGKVVNYLKPYCHVERYGAVPSNVGDSTEAIQTAYDIAEKLGDGNIAENGESMFPVRYGGVPYLITKTIRLKANPLTSKESRPIASIGEPFRIHYSNPGKGTVIIPRIPNHTGKTYANAFAINVKYNSDIDEDDTTAFGGGTGAKIMNNISFENITFALTEEEMAIYNINAIKMYRTRSKVKNVNFVGMNGVVQPDVDRLGASSYCDFSIYEDINFKNIKTTGLTLCTPDNSSIKRITNHTPTPTFDNIIKIVRGGGITIENIHHALHGTDGEEFIPRNDGTGVEGTKALIKLIVTEGVSIDGTYVERQFADYMIYLENVSNVHMKGHTERFVGNGFCLYAGNNKNVVFDNIYRHANMTSEYYDFHYKAGAIVHSEIKNIITEDWYNESFSLAITDYRNSLYTKATNKHRNVKKTFTETQMNMSVTGEDLTFIISYDGAAWKVEDRAGTNLTSAFGTITWDTDGLRLNNSILYPYRLKAVSPCYIGASTLPYLPVVRRGVEKIQFMNIATAARISTPDVNMAFMITVNTIINKKIIS
jgi:hypothetical protein